jgi:hypothetical protein
VLIALRNYEDSVSAVVTSMLPESARRDVPDGSRSINQMARVRA